MNPASAMPDHRPDGHVKIADLHRANAVPQPHPSAVVMAARTNVPPVSVCARNTALHLIAFPESKGSRTIPSTHPLDHPPPPPPPLPPLLSLKPDRKRRREISAAMDSLSERGNTSQAAIPKSKCSLGMTARCRVHASSNRESIRRQKPFAITTVMSSTPLLSPLGAGLTLLFTQSQPDWFGAVFPKSHSEIFNLRFEPVNFIFKSLHGIFDRIPCPCPAHFWLVITVCKRQSDFVFCGFVIWVFHHHLKASGSRNGRRFWPGFGSRIWSGGPIARPFWNI